MSWRLPLPPRLSNLLPGCFLRMRTRLACRHNLGNLLLVLLVGVFLYLLALQPMARLVERYKADSMQAMVENIQRICDQGYHELLRLGLPPDSPEVILRQATTLSFIEDFASSHQSQVLLVDEERVLLTPAMSTSTMPLAIGDRWREGDPALAAPAVIEDWLGSTDQGPNLGAEPWRMSEEGRKYYLQGGTFSPWGWRFLVFKDTTHFRDSMDFLLYAYVGTIAVLLGWVLLGAYFFRRQVETPIQELTAALERGEKPHYQGVAEFEFLSNQFTAVLTEREVMRRRFFQQQKLESIGVLAGGIAHDFNNLLASLYGQISLANLSLPPGHEAGKSLEVAEKSADRARFLTRQLLDVATGASLNRRPVAVSELLREIAEFALTGSRCERDFVAEEPLWEVELDREQMGNVFHNLVLNAREAMADLGTLAVSCDNLLLTPESDTTLPPGPYVRVIIRDEGGGIAPEMIHRIFEPYFSTKERGSRKGTGLGLSICYSVVTGHGGLIEASSRQGQGATFTLYLPANSAPAGAPTAGVGAAVWERLNQEGSA